MTSKRTISACIIVLLSSRCERVEYYPDKPLTDGITRVLAHKGGGGSFGEGNSFEACVYGFERMEGIELDLQISEDNQIWLSHSSNLVACGGFQGKCFAGITTKSIIEIDSCLGPAINFTTLEKVFEYMSTHHPQKYISLDVKAWTPCELNDFNVTRKMNQLGEQIIALTNKFGLQGHVMVESETGDFLYYIKTHSNFIETYLTTLGDFELGAARALDAGFNGLSYQFKPRQNLVREQVDLLHRKGLKIQLWTIYDSEALEEAKSLGVDFIQTDDL
jgi:glycerophosphoryl diester phosphodiesterase